MGLIAFLLFVISRAIQAESNRESFASFTLGGRLRQHEFYAISWLSCMAVSYRQRCRNVCCQLTVRDTYWTQKQICWTQRAL